MIALPSYIDPDAWAGFEEMRRLIKKPMTDRARKLVLVRLEAIRKAGHCPNAALDQSTENSWQTVYQPRELELTVRASSEADKTRAYLDSQKPVQQDGARRAEIAEMLRNTAATLRRVA